jgi:hypothetical protein
MIRLAPLLLASIVCGCGCSCAVKPQQAMAEPPATVVVAAKSPAAPSISLGAPGRAAPADPIQAIATLSPRQVIAAAEAAREDASGYVAWRESKPSNIERLTVLTRDLNDAITQMRGHEVGQKYPPADVSAARAALRALRLFLREKDD